MCAIYSIVVIELFTSGQYHAPPPGTQQPNGIAFDRTMRILVTDKLDRTAIDGLKSQGFDVVELVGAEVQDLAQAVADVDGWIIRSGTKITADLIGRANNLKVIGRAGVGVDNIDIEAATRSGVAVLNTPTGNTIAAVEHAIALLLALVRHIPAAHNALVNENRWERSAFTGVELYGKTLGVLGLGKIGSRVATRCKAMELQILAYDPFLTEERARGLGVQLTNDLDEVLSRSDFLSLHLPSTPDTEHILNKESLAHCKQGIRIVNCARGNLIDESALAEALHSGHVAGVALDVFENEPPTGSPLLSAPNVVATPHLGASTIESQQKVSSQIADQVAEALSRGIFREAVNIPVNDWGTFTELKHQFSLAERLGQVAQQQSGGAISRIEVAYCGEAFSEVQALNQILLKGLLKPILGDSVNSVNAPLLAEDRGIELTSSRREQSQNYQTLINLRIYSNSGVHSLSGTTFTDNEPRLVELDGFEVELFLTGFLLVFGNYDKPGVIGDVGAVLGKHDVNIAHFSLGRKIVGGEALGVVAVDELVPADVIDELSALANMRWVYQVILN